MARARGSERRGLVLLVEDDDEVAALTREMLTDLGLRLFMLQVPPRHWVR